jgi:hypothetical protein
MTTYLEGLQSAGSSENDKVRLRNALAKILACADALSTGAVHIRDSSEIGTATAASVAELLLKMPLIQPDAQLSRRLAISRDDGVMRTTSTTASEHGPPRTDHWGRLTCGSMYASYQACL